MYCIKFLKNGIKMVGMDDKLKRIRSMVINLGNKIGLVEELSRVWRREYWKK